MISDGLGGTMPVAASSALLAVLLLSCACVACGGATASITVRPAKVIGPVNTLILGSNMLAYQGSRELYGNRGSGIWDPERRRSVPEMARFARDCGLSVSRWPGGCGTHRYLWKKTVGPLADRPKQQFGLPEFLRNCVDIGAMPILTLSAFVCPPQDAADIVEYLNAPNDGRNPNGGRDWAALRAADGHPAPWGVVWFEFGNESDHGDHKGHRLTPQQYAAKFLAVRKAMKAVDPRIKLGVVLENTSTGGVGPWTRTVLRDTARDLDFAIHHCYLPRYYRKDGVPPARELFEIALAGDAQIADTYRQLNALVRKTTGRDDVRWAITEFNGHFVQSKPVPYRHCLGNALVNAEIIRTLMQPEHRVALANHWQFANEYWGSVRGDKPPYVTRPNYHVFALYHQHFGHTLVAADVACGTYDTDGGYGVLPRSGEPAEFLLHADNLLPKQPWQLEPVSHARHRIEGDVLAVEFDGTKDVNYFHAEKRMPARPLTGYRLTGWVKTDALTTANGAAFQIGDGRGWVATRSCSVAPSVSGTSDWTKTQTDYVSLRDTKDLVVMARRLEGHGVVKGKAWYRDVQVRRFRPKSYGAAPYLTVNASTSRDGKTTYLMIVNKNLREPVACALSVAGRPVGAARAWTLTGPGPEATNEREPLTVTVRELGAAVADGKAAATLPPCSLTAVELR